MKSILAIIVGLTTVMTLIAVPAIAGIRTQAQVATQLPANIPVPANTDHLPVETYQNDNHIVITVTKNPETPPGPIIVIPPGPEGGNNGTIITPGENITAGNPGNITIITPGGNVTEIPSANDSITRVDNETVIITPPDRNVTETPGNVTVIDPPPHATQLPANIGNQTAAPAPCKCNQTTLPPVTVTPAPGQNVTVGEQPLPPAANQTTTTNETITSNQTTTTTPSNQTNFPAQLPAGNQTGNTTGGNQTQTNSNSTTSSQPPVAQQLPAVASIFPGFHITKVAYHGPNGQYLNR